jgi:coenzyme F420-reducing hydrogenase gamma subunit
MVARGTPCLGPITQAGCGALCPSFARGCFGCFGPMETPNADALAAKMGELGLERDDVVRALRTFNAAAPAFKAASESHERRQA